MKGFNNINFNKKGMTGRAMTSGRSNKNSYIIALLIFSVN